MDSFYYCFAEDFVFGFRGPPPLTCETRLNRMLVSQIEYLIGRQRRGRRGASLELRGAAASGQTDRCYQQSCCAQQATCSSWSGMCSCGERNVQSVLASGIKLRVSTSGAVSCMQPHARVFQETRHLSNSRSTALRVSASLPSNGVCKGTRRRLWHGCRVGRKAQVESACKQLCQVLMRPVQPAV